MGIQTSLSEESYWVVFRVGGDAPTRRHKTFSTALEEAKRLANANPGVEFVVFQSHSTVFQPGGLMVVKHTEECPF